MAATNSAAATASVGCSPITHTVSATTASHRRHQPRHHEQQGTDEKRRLQHHLAVEAIGEDAPDHAQQRATKHLGRESERHGDRRVGLRQHVERQRHGDHAVAGLREELGADETPQRGSPERHENRLSDPSRLGEPPAGPWTGCGVR